MLAQRLKVAIVLIPAGVLLFAVGGWFLALVVAAGLGYAAWEYWRMYTLGGYYPSAAVLITGTGVLVLARQAFGFTGSDLLLCLLILAAMAIQAFNFEKGVKTSAVDFTIILGGILYLGWLGAYIVSLRNLPDGLWWLMLVLPGMWFSDGAAFFIGRKFGRHKISERVSPKKTWEGYFGGLVFGALGTMLLASLWHMRAPDITPLRGLILGIIISGVSPMGDFGESMIKRSFGMKDASGLLPGHGGVMDRIDSWLWAAPIGYYLIYFLWT
jgi:phosphatidate cytidylyltransferase